MRDGLGMEMAQEGGHLLWDGLEPPVTASLKGHGPKGLCLSPSGAPEELSVLGVPEGRFPLYLHQFLTSPAWEGRAGLIPKIPAMELEFSGT